MNNDNDSYQEKDIAFYSATVNAWYTTRFEKDKHLLSLSSGGIALLVTLATAIGTANGCTAAMYILAVFCFLICISSVLVIFGRNAEHLGKVVRGNVERDPVLGLLDKTASASFIFGVVFTLLVGVFSGIENFRLKEAIMAKDSDRKTVTGDTELRESVDGAGGLRPQKPTTGTSGNGQGGQSGSNDNSNTSDPKK